jgi:hypothetical protein
MTHVALGVLLALAAAGEAKEARKGGGVARAGARGGRTILLTEENAQRPHEILTARGEVTTVEFPEEMTAPPQCNDCTEVAKPADGLFVIQAGRLSRFLTIWPGNSARRWAAAGASAIVPVRVRLEHAEVTLLLKRVDRSRAQKRVTFVAPSRVMENEYLRVERQKLEAAVAQQVEEGVKREFQQAFLAEHRCARSRARARHDDIVLEVNEICSFGDRVVIVFTVENRARAPFESGTLVVNKGAKVEEYALGAPIEFGEERTAAIVGKLPKGVRARGRYEVALHEGGGKGRVVTLSGVEI